MIPNFNSTEEALAFGMSATEEEVIMMKKIRNICEVGFYNLFEKDDSDEAFALMAQLSTQAQLMREACEVSQYA